MRVLRFLPYKVWIHTTGRTASIRGACPWSSDADKAQWRLEERGYTWECDDGTYGLGRIPAKTEQEAIEVMDRINGKK